MTKYIKTGTTEFEQFDGSDEMCKKYGIRKDTEYLISDDPLEYQIAPYQIESLEGWLNLNVDDWIATGAEDEHWPVKDEIFQKTYTKLPVIPQYVANYIEEQKEHHVDLFGAISSCGKFESFPMFDEAKAHIWVSGNCKDFSRAWLDGYEVAEVEE